MHTEDIDPIVAGFAALGWSRTRGQYLRYLTEQRAGRRTALVADSAPGTGGGTDRTVTGYLTVVWQPRYPPFRAAGIPEIRDLNVFGPFRRRGIASALLDEAEKLAAERTDTVGIGFGLTADYGTAQRLYVRRGYVPDGNGVQHDGAPIPPGTTIRIDDSVHLMLIKRLR